MRHNKVTHKLNRTADQRKALFRNLITSLILHEQLEITQAKAKAIKPLVDNMINRVQRTEKGLAIRYLESYLYDETACRKVMEVLKERYQDRTSGFTRIKKVKYRTGDCATMVKIELL